MRRSLRPRQIFALIDDIKLKCPHWHIIVLSALGKIIIDNIKSELYIYKTST